MSLGDKPPRFLSTRSQSSLESCVFWNASMLLGFGDCLVIARKIKMVRFVVCNSDITSFLCVTGLPLLLNCSPVSSLLFVCSRAWGRGCVSQSYLGPCAVHGEERGLAAGAEVLSDGVAASCGPGVKCKLLLCCGNGSLEGPPLMEASPHYCLCCVIHARTYVHVYALYCVYADKRCWGTTPSTTIPAEAQERT